MNGVFETAQQNAKGHDDESLHHALKLRRNRKISQKISQKILIDDLFSVDSNVSLILMMMMI